VDMPPPLRGCEQGDPFIGEEYGTRVPDLFCDRGTFRLYPGALDLERRLMALRAGASTPGAELPATGRIIRAPSRSTGEIHP
jgi:hypothetical protein